MRRAGRHAPGVPQRARHVSVRRSARYRGRLDCDLRADHRPDRGDRGVLAGAHPAGKDRREPPPPAEGRHQDAVPALARVRRHVMADRLAVGVCAPGDVQGGLRYREARGLFRGDGPQGQAGQLLREELVHLREELDAMAATGNLPPVLKNLRAELDTLHARAAAPSEGSK